MSSVSSSVAVAGGGKRSPRMMAKEKDCLLCRAASFGRRVGRPPAVPLGEPMTRLWSS